MTQQPSNRSDPDLSAEQEELVRLALDTIRAEIRRTPPQLGAPGALAMIRQADFKTEVEAYIEETQNWKSTTQPAE